MKMAGSRQEKRGKDMERNKAERRIQHRCKTRNPRRPKL